MPMKRSRVFTMHAMMSEKVEKSARSQQHAGQHAEDGLRIMPDRDVHDERDEINDGRLHEAAESGGDRLAENQRASPGGAHQKLVHDAEIALPNHCDAVEDRAEQHALGEDSRRDEREVANLSGVNAVDVGEDLTEHHQPQHRLYCAREYFGRIADELDQFYFCDRGTLSEESFHGVLSTQALSGPAGLDDVAEISAFADPAARVMCEHVVHGRADAELGPQLGWFSDDGDPP